MGRKVGAISTSSAPVPPIAELALEQAGDKPQPLVHEVTLLPRHAPSSEGAKSVTHVPGAGIGCYLSFRKDIREYRCERFHQVGNKGER